MDTVADSAGAQQDAEQTDGKVVNLAVFKIKKSLRSEGFDLLTDKQGKLTLVLRRPQT